VLEPIERIPAWLRRPAGSSTKTAELKKILRTSALNTVCEEARCPNIEECFSKGTATFMILGDICTRGCRFCSVHTGKPQMSPLAFEQEAQRVVEATKKLALKYVVITSVARDDLADGGASGFVATVSAIRKQLPDVKIEVLVPDFRGNKNSTSDVVNTGIVVFNHNLETVPRLYRKVRPGSVYKRSLEVLEFAKKSNAEVLTKTGIMLGLGEEKQEVYQLLEDCKKHQIDIFTAGQYMRPSLAHLKVEKYLTPEEFEHYRDYAKSLGFKHVFIGPLVRSSYHAGEEVEHAL
jgi:lipoic acid synthetase